MYPLAVATHGVAFCNNPALVFLIARFSFNSPLQLAVN